MEWSRRKVSGVGYQVSGRKPRASWAAVGLAVISCLVQGVNFVRNDIAPLLEAAKQNTVMLKRIEARMEDHERRLSELERGRK